MLVALRPKSVAEVRDANALISPQAAKQTAKEIVASARGREGVEVDGTDWPTSPRGPRL